MAPIPGTISQTFNPNFVGPRAPELNFAEVSAPESNGFQAVDSFEPRSCDPLSGDWNDIIQQNKLRQMANGRSSRQMVFGGPGDFSDPRANLEELRKMRNQAVDKRGPFSAEALLLAGSEVFYQMSPAPAAQQTGEAWGEPSSSKSEKAWASGNLALHLLEIVPAASLIANGARGVRAASVGSRSFRATGNSLGLAGRFRARQSAAGFAKLPDKTKTAAAASQAIRQTSSGMRQVANMQEFFESTKLGKALSEQAQRTGKTFQGAPIYKASGKVQVGETVFKKGDNFYLDNLHKDHIEVFNKCGVLKDVLDFGGDRLIKKLRAAEKQGRNIKDLVSYGDSVSKSHIVA